MLGLFHRAIPQSGNEMTLWGVNSPLGQPDTYIPQIADYLGCNQTTIEDKVNDCLMFVDPDDLFAAPFRCPVSWKISGYTLLIIMKFSTFSIYWLFSTIVVLSWFRSCCGWSLYP